MTQQFFGTATGDPLRLQRMLGFQSGVGIPQDDLTKMQPFKGFGGPIAMSPSYIDAQRLNSSGEAEPQMTSKLDYGTQRIHFGDFDPAEPAQLKFLLALMGGYDAAVTGSSTRYRFSRKQAVVGTAFNNKLTYINDTDKGIPLRFTDVMAKGFSMQVGPRQNCSLVAEVRAGKVDTWGDAVVAGTGVVAPILRHYSTDNFAADSLDYDLYVKIITETATEVTFQVKKGAAGSLSATQTATKGVWTDIYLGSPAVTPYGNWGQQIQVLFVVSIDGTYVVDDVWQFPKRRVLTIDDADYATSRAIAEVNARFYLDGQEFGVDNGVTINVDRANVITRYSGGGEQPIGTDAAGITLVTVAVNRRLVDMDLQVALMNRASRSLVVDLRSNTAIQSGIYYRGAFVLPQLKATGQFHDAEDGAQNKDEQMIFRAEYPDADFSYAGETDIRSQLEVIVDTDVLEADLVAA